MKKLTAFCFAIVSMLSPVFLTSGAAQATSFQINQYPGIGTAGSVLTFQHFKGSPSRYIEQTDGANTM
jgi:hypothetical protein